MYYLVQGDVLFPGITGEVMFCSKCGELIPPDANYCSKCGLVVRRIDQPVVNAVGAGGAPVYLSGDPSRPPRFSGTAVTGFVLVFFFPLVGLIVGYVARSQIKKSRGALRGWGLATAAVIIGWVWTIGAILFWGIALSSSSFWEGFYSSM